MNVSHLLCAKLFFKRSMVIKSLTFTITLNRELLSFSPSWETEARSACWNEQPLANQVIPCRTGSNSYVDGCKCLQAFLMKTCYIFMYVCTSWVLYVVF